MNSSKSSGQLVTWSIPEYFSAMDSAGSMTMAVSSALMLTYVPVLILVAFLMFLGMMSLPFSSIFAVAWFIVFPTLSGHSTHISFPTIS